MSFHPKFTLHKTLQCWGSE